MPIVDISKFPTSGAVLAIDPGKKTIGVAVSDAAQIIAMPVGGIHRQKLANDLEQLFSLYDARKCVGMIMGLPLNMNGEAGPKVQSAKSFAHSILNYHDIPIAFQDERLTTQEAERAMISADLSRKKRAQRIDQSAATFILQAALGRLREIARIKG